MATAREELQSIGSEERKYFFIMLNMADESDLDPYEFRLLAHYRRVGETFEATRTTARICQMSEKTVQRKRKSLAQKGWIRIAYNEDTDTLLIIVVDRMAENVQKYSPSTPRSQSPPPPVTESTKEEPYEEDVITLPAPEVVNALAEISQETFAIGMTEKKFNEVAFAIQEKYDDPRVAADRVRDFLIWWTKYKATKPWLKDILNFWNSFEEDKDPFFATNNKPSRSGKKKSIKEAEGIAGEIARVVSAARSSREFREMLEELGLLEIYDRLNANDGYFRGMSETYFSNKLKFDIFEVME